MGPLKVDLFSETRYPKPTCTSSLEKYIKYSLARELKNIDRMKRELLTTSNKDSASQSRNGKYLLLRSSYGVIQFLSFESRSSSSATYEETFARHDAESAWAPEACVRHRTTAPVATAFLQMKTIFFRHLVNSLFMGKPCRSCARFSLRDQVGK
jgi:hypothetical protein